MINSDWNGTITYNGISSPDLGVIVRKLPVLRKPKRKGNVISIPGRNGSLAIETGGFETYIQPYEIAMTDKRNGVAIKAREIASWLLNTSGFIRLEDSFEKDVYRMARFAGPFDIAPIMEQDGKVTIEFECQPQRFLKIGENRMRFYQSLTSGAWALYVELKEVNHLVISFTGDDYYSDTVNIFRRYPENGGFETVYGSNGYVDIDPSNYNGEEYQSVFIQGSGSKENETTVGVYLNGQRVFAMENGTGYLYNPTAYDARPLMYAEAINGATPVAQSVYMTYSKTVLETGDYYTFYNHPLGISNEISLNNYKMARITTRMTGNGCIYAFFDSSGKLISGRWGNSTETFVLDEEPVPIPTGATKMVVGAYDRDGSYTPVVTLASTTNNTVGFFLGNTLVDIDFGSIPSVYIDSELHDAYHADGSNGNDKVSFKNWDEPYKTFPVLYPKRNALNISGADVRLDITPRWWLL